jgi:hypothetical protein
LDEGGGGLAAAGVPERAVVAHFEWLGAWGVAGVLGVLSKGVRIVKRALVGGKEGVSIGGTKQRVWQTKRITIKKLLKESSE